MSRLKGRKISLSILHFPFFSPHSYNVCLNGNDKLALEGMCLKSGWIIGDEKKLEGGGGGEEYNCVSKMQIWNGYEDCTEGSINDQITNLLLGRRLAGPATGFSFVPPFGLGGSARVPSALNLLGVKIRERGGSRKTSHGDIVSGRRPGLNCPGLPSRPRLSSALASSSRKSRPAPTSFCSGAQQRAAAKISSGG